MNNTGFRGIGDKLSFYRNYRFVLAFENKELEGWTTEKMYDPFAAYAVPIFWGDPCVNDFFNPKAFINARDFKNDATLADYVCQVDTSPELYRQYLKAPPFKNNLPPEEFSRRRVLDFFDRIFSTPIRPAAQRRWYFSVTKWRLAKRNKLPHE